ncbi:MAG: Mrp/NBP35 family ATP-binding protein [Rhodospirillum sp.]|nr:Mrp/NBP35 family ATP-binding protein [Rhodospirillum sp.]MCF8491823.1 Mrp/NBP35 family ATP-binding protein [Rhodospirillum sp.]MCF8500516.1 Mrp/NBP35 family ATP-binding protein [Rhodospirillum sp.]
MSTVTQDDILKALATVKTPTGKDLVAQGWVDNISVQPGDGSGEGSGDGAAAVILTIAVPLELGDKLEPLRRQAEDVTRALPGVGRVAAVLTAQRPEPPPLNAKPRGPTKIDLPTIKHVIAIASGKGGVGKSTTTANLALALASMGLRVGVYDADIHGPSMPRMLGVRDGKPQSAGGDRAYPVIGHGLKIMSIGFMVAEDDPVIWRGPMVMGALEKLLRDVDWGDLDILLIDMPPGTGDAQLTISQKVPLSGVVIVSTPQDIALLDARKGLNMFRKVDVPILGVIENMSYHVCANCGHREEVFSHGGAQRTAEELAAEFLGELPLDIRIRATADGGAPVTVSDPNGPHAQAYKAIAKRIWEKLEHSEEGEDENPMTRLPRKPR